MTKTKLTVGERIRRERNPETSAQRSKRWWHLKRGDVLERVFILLALALFVVFVGAAKSAYRSLVLQVETSRWWNGLSPATQSRLTGFLLGILGSVLLWRRWKARDGISSFWQVKMLLVEVAMVIGGLVMVGRAGGFW